MPKPIIIAITGSAGKSTTKEMLAAILSRRLPILKTNGNLNDVYHTHLYRKQLTRRHLAAVLEYGMSGPGQIAAHCRILQPDISIITNVGSAHIGKFGGSIVRLANAKSEIIAGMKKSGLLVINADDPNTRYLPISTHQGPLYRVSQQKKADIYATDLSLTKTGSYFTAHTKSHAFRLFIPVIAKHNIHNALFAIAVADYLGFTKDDIRIGLANFQRLPHRLTILASQGGRILIDDTYSANPHAVRAAIDVLASFPNRPKIAILGSMLSLGILSTKAHQTIGTYLDERQIDQIITFGEEAKAIAIGALAKGFPKDRVHAFLQRKVMHAYLANHLPKNAVILIKGSHAMHMVDTVRFLRQKRRES